MSEATADSVDVQRRLDEVETSPTDNSSGAGGVVELNEPVNDDHDLRDPCMQTDVDMVDALGGEVDIDCPPKDASITETLCTETSERVSVDVGTVARDFVAPEPVLQESKRHTTSSVITVEDKTNEGGNSDDRDMHLESLIANIVSDSASPKSLHTLDCVSPSRLASSRVSAPDMGVPSMYKVWPSQTTSYDGVLAGSTNAMAEGLKVMEGCRSVDVSVDGAIAEEKEGNPCDNKSSEGKQDRPEAMYEEYVAEESQNGQGMVDETEAGRIRETEVVVDAIDSVLSTHVTVSDSSPPPPRSAHVPSELEIALANTLLAGERHAPGVLFPRVDLQSYSLFQKTLTVDRNFLHISQDRYDLENSFFLDLARSQEWVSTKHMEVLMTYLGAKHAHVLAQEHSSFASPWFVKYLQGKYRKFKAAINKNMVRWDSAITDYVTSPGKSWLNEIHTVYAPMIWNDAHWVGLAVHLETHYVKVMDPFPSLYADRKVDVFMAPVVEMLPHLISKFCPSATQNNNPFTYARMSTIYENKRAGDCGPVAVKFMEMHAYDDPPPHLVGVTDAMVDDFRKTYAMELYRDFVVFWSILEHIGHEEHGGTWRMEAAQLDTQRKKGEAILKTSSTVHSTNRSSSSTRPAKLQLDRAGESKSNPKNVASPLTSL
ncbi:unnamed protein product [Microthlaspi erraticum]|uniref:Ubiquitin-like protease family profile domain-containing protein n=1 Tax=Microthlaspi erraticum TaxID=1685480 RepID=A0A6D2HGY0_9BRAS|nr:unnamed protein product [Microthlaspi erraticum]